MTKTFLKILILLTGVCSIVIFTLWYSGEVVTEKELKTFGIVETTEVNISSKIAGRIASILVEEGDIVVPGRPVVLLEKKEMILEVEKAKAYKATIDEESKEKDAYIDEIKAMIQYYQANLISADANIEKALAILKEKKGEWQRAGDLLKKGIFTQSQYDISEARYKSAGAMLTYDKSQKKAIESQYFSARAQLRSAEASREVAVSKAKEADIAIGIAKVRLEDREIFSPIKGIVSMKVLEKGEYVSPGMIILTIQDMDRPWVRVDIDETGIGNVRINDPAAIKVLSLPSLTFSGRVFEIGNEGYFATERNVKGGRQDIKTFRVKVLIEKPEEGLLKTGMTAEVDFGR